MKKILALLLVLVMLLAMTMTGCGGSKGTAESDQPDSTQNEQREETAKADADAEAAVTEGMGELLSAAYVDMMKNNEYLMKYKATMDYDGQAMEIETTMAVKGDDMAMISNMQGTESTIIIQDDIVHMVDHASKTVTSWTQSQGTAGMDTGMDTGAIDTDGITYLGNGKEDGLVYEEYETADNNVKYYFDGKELVKISVVTEGQTMEMEILEMSKDVPASMFEIPGGYQKIDL